MIQPGSITAQLPNGPDYVVRELADIRREMRESVASVAASFNNTVASLNLAVASMIAPQSNEANGAGLGVSTTSTVQASCTFTVPAGYTQAIVNSTATAEAINSTGAGDYLYVLVQVNSDVSSELYNSAQAGWATSVCQPYNSTLSGLVAGSTITVSAAVRTSSAAWAASPSNLTTIYAQMLFLR